MKSSKKKATTPAEVKEQAVDKAMEVKDDAKKVEAKKEEPKKEEAPKVEEKKSEAPKAAKKGKTTKAVKDDSNMGTFLEGEDIELKDLKFVVKEVTGLEVVLKRKDFR